MRDYQRDLLPERNPVTHKIHRHEVLWQVTLPLIIGALLAVGLMVLAGAATRPAVSRWSEISSIWLILPVMLCGLITLAVLVGFTFGIVWIVTKLPPAMLKVQNLFTMVGVYVRRFSDKAVAPILSVEGYRASLQSLLHNLFGK